MEKDGEKEYNIFYFAVTVFYGILLKFATTHDEWNIEKKDFTYENMLYFSTTAFSTSGYGDIYPVSTKSRLLVISMQIIILTELIEMFLHN